MGVPLTPVSSKGQALNTSKGRARYVMLSEAKHPRGIVGIGSRPGFFTAFRMTWRRWSHMTGAVAEPLEGCPHPLPVIPVPDTGIQERSVTRRGRAPTYKKPPGRVVGEQDVCLSETASISWRSRRWTGTTGPVQIESSHVGHT